MPPETVDPAFEVRVVDSLTVDEARRAHAFVDAATAADGVAPLSEQSVHAIDRPGGSDSAVRHVISEFGYANVLIPREGGSPMIEAVVDPQHRRRGQGRALLDAAFGVARDHADPADPDGGPRAWAHGDLPGAVALAATLGLTRRRELLQLRTDLTGDTELPPLVVVDSLALRTYADVPDTDESRAAVEAEILRVNNAAFDWHPEQGGWSSADIDERLRADWFDPAGLFLAFDSGAADRGATDGGAADRAGAVGAETLTDNPLLGFHWTKMQSPTLGEVYIVGVDPAAQGRGLGRVLTLAGLHYFADRGVEQVMLYVEGDNTAALRTYGRLGFERHAIDVAYG